MEKTDEQYFKFNTVFTVLQLALWVCANTIDLIQIGKGGNNIFDDFMTDTILMQLFFVEYYGCVLGGMSYIKKLRNVMICFDFVVLVIAVVLMVWSFLWGVLENIFVGTDFPVAFFAAIPSLLLLAVKTAEDGKIGISHIAHRKRKDR